MTLGKNQSDDHLRRVWLASPMQGRKQIQVKAVSQNEIVSVLKLESVSSTTLQPQNMSNFQKLKALVFSNAQLHCK